MVRTIPRSQRSRFLSRFHRRQIDCSSEHSARIHHRTLWCAGTAAVQLSLFPTRGRVRSLRRAIGLSKVHCSHRRTRGDRSTAHREGVDDGQHEQGRRMVGRSTASHASLGSATPRPRLWAILAGGASHPASPSGFLARGVSGRRPSVEQSAARTAWRSNSVPLRAAGGHGRRDSATGE